MAFSCSSSGLYNSAYRSNGGSAGIDFKACRSRSVVVEAAGCRFKTNPKMWCSLILKEVKFSADFRTECSSFCSKERKLDSTIRCRMRGPVEAHSVERPITILQEGGAISSNKEATVPESKDSPVIDCENGGGFGDKGKFPPGGGGGGGNDGGDNEDDTEEFDEFGPILKFDEVIREAEERGVTLPSDMLEAAKTTGIQKVLLFRYLDLQASGWPLGYIMKSCSLFRNRMLADPSFLFKVGTEIIIDSCCATFAEVQKRGKDFWAEFELYTADLLVGLVVNVALVGMLAPYARFGKPSASKSLFGRVAHAYGALPSSVFEAGRPGCTFSIQQRMGTYFFKGFLYGSVGFACGLVGQGIANLIMTAKRSVKKSEEDIPVPPLVKSAALWGLFLAVSSNTRYQIVNGLERLVEASPVSKRVPPVALAFTVGVRLANNIYGGMQFVDWARWSGVQ